MALRPCGQRRDSAFGIWPMTAARGARRSEGSQHGAFPKPSWLAFLGASHSLWPSGNTTNLQSRKSARCLFSMQHLMASRGLAPAFGQRRPTLLNQEKWDAPRFLQIPSASMGRFKASGAQSQRDRQRAATGPPANAIPTPGRENLQTPFNPGAAGDGARHAIGKKSFTPNRSLCRVVTIFINLLNYKH